MKYSPNNIQAGDFPPKTLVKPEIYPDDNGLPVFRGGMNYRHVLNRLDSGPGIKVQGSYATAMAFYSWLKKRISSKHPVNNYISSRITREIINKKSSKIFVKINHHMPDLEKAPEIPWLKIFYPGNPDFLISMPDLLGMNGAWQWYDKGIKYPVLEQRLHPYYGVYFPTRTEHLILFDQWLEKNKTRFTIAADIGTGCGILSFTMARHGMKRIYATDINPNAVYSTSGEIERFRLGKTITIEQTSFFGSMEADLDLAVFNPPWIPGKCNSITDMGVYYGEGFFEKFFSEAANRLAPGTILIVIFSNFAIEAGITDQNPVEKAFNLNKFMLEEKITSDVTEKAKARSKNWLNQLRSKEKIELWVFKRTGN
jgi:tRNA1(Val) A37 N6-methylase TrmN6